MRVYQNACPAVAVKSTDHRAKSWGSSTSLPHSLQAFQPVLIANSITMSTAGSLQLRCGDCRMRNVNREVKRGGRLWTSIINTGKSEITNEQFSIILTTMVDWRKNTLHRDYADIWWILTDFQSHEIIPTNFEYLIINFWSFNHCYKCLFIYNYKHCYLTNREWSRRSGPLTLSCWCWLSICTTCSCNCFAIPHHYNNKSTLA